MTVYPQRLHGKITGRFVVEVTLDGRRLRKVVETFKDAAAAEASLLASLKAGAGTEKLDTRVNPTSLLDLLKRGGDAIWGSSSMSEIAPARIRRAAEIIGRVPFADLSTTDLDRVVATLKSDGLAASTINQYLSALHTLLAWGEKRGYRPKATLHFDRLAMPEQTLRLLNDGEDDAIVAALETQGRRGAEVADFVRVLLTTGLRRSELLLRERSDLRVDETGTSWLRVSKTKTKRERSIPLTPEAASILQSRLPWTINAPVVRDHWDRAKEKLGLAGDRRVVIHALRHTVATRLIRAGVDPFTTGQLLGHSNIRTTQRYVHVLADAKVAAVAKLTTPKGSSSLDDHPVTVPVRASDEGQ